MNDCNLCRYIESETNPNKQTCSKWVNNNDFNLPCRPVGGNPGDAPTDDNDDCQLMDCPSHCQYPFTKQVYNDEDHPEEHYDNLGMKPAFRYLNTNPEAISSYPNPSISKLSSRAGSLKKRKSRKKRKNKK